MLRVVTLVSALHLLGFAGQVVDGFYLPGVAPTSYEEGDDVDLKVNKLR